MSEPCDANRTLGTADYGRLSRPFAGPFNAGPAGYCDRISSLLQRQLQAGSVLQLPTSLNNSNRSHAQIEGRGAPLGCLFLHCRRLCSDFGPQRDAGSRDPTIAEIDTVTLGVVPLLITGERSLRNDAGRPI
jgi:hypothetical protein